MASAVALAINALAAPQALAITSCPGTGSNNIINVAPGIETGCNLMAGDALNINLGASISDTAVTPVKVATGVTAGALTNNGTINFTYTPGTTSWNGLWSPAVQGAFSSVSNSGTIQGAVFSTSGSAGILLTGTSGTLTNTGTISSGGTAIAIGSSTWGSAGPVSTPGALASLINSGTIQSTWGTAIKVINGSSLTSLENQTGGIISGFTGGLMANGVTMNSFVNQGTISATGTMWGVGSLAVGIYGAGSTSWIGPSTPVFNSTPAVLSGGLTNSGTISGTGGGIQLDTVVVGSVGTPANITNSGRITGSGGIGLDIRNSTLHGDIINQAGGVIGYTGSGSGTSMGISVSSGSSLGSITNSGTVSGGIVVRSGSALTGSITNATGGLITNSGWGGIQVDWATVGGDVLNAGAITMASRSAGINIRGATVTGTVSNTGTITSAPSSSSSSGGPGVSLSSATVGSVSNSGIITTAGGNGLDVSNTTVNGDITNTVNGMISAIGSWGTGVRLGSSTVSGGFINNGTINADTGVSIGGTQLTNGINNGGQVSGGRFGFWIADMSSASVGNLTNSGTINGVEAGVNIGGTTTAVYTGLQTLNNSGTISSNGTGTTQNANYLLGGGGIHLFNASMTSITNSGTISGTVKAIWVDTRSVTAIPGVQAAWTSNSTLTDLFIDGNNTAQFNGMVDAQATNTTILNGATYTLRGTDDFRVASFTNNGTAQFAAGATNFTLANVTGNTFTNNGVLGVGAGDTGTLTGDYTQAASGTLRVGASADATYGKLVVSGTATLPANARIDVNVTNPNFSFTTTGMAGVLTAGTLTSDGTFAVTDNSALFNFTASLNGNAVDLALAAVSSGGAGTTTTAFNNLGSPAGAGAARTIDSLLASYTANGTTGNAGMDAVLAKLGTFTTDAELVAAVMQTVPQVGAAMKRVSASSRAAVTAALAARIRTGSGQSSGDDFVTDGNVWVKPLGAWAKQDDNGGIPGYKSNTYGLVAGADGEMSGGARIGMALGVTNTSVDANGGLQSGKVTGYQVALYGSKDMSSGYMVDWQGDYSYNQNSTSRDITLMGPTASSDYTGTAAHLGAGVSRGMALDSGDVLTPSLHIDYTSLRNSGYTETGAGPLNLTVDKQSFRELLYVADVMWTHNLASGAGLTANLGVAYDAYAKQDDITSTYAGGGAAFGTSGIEPSPTTVRAGLGYAQTTASGMEVSLRYDVESRSGYAAQSLSAKLGKPF